MNLFILSATFASMEQGAVFIDDQDRIAYCNPPAEKIQNAEPKEILARSIL
jgi:PAS domain-containing protein